MSKRLSFSSKPKILSAKDRTVHFTASNETLDCYDEVVRAAGWRFNRFQKNAPFVDSHNYSSVAFKLGIVTAWAVQGGNLIEGVQYLPQGTSALADMAWKMTESGFLPAVSVGFLPVRVRSRWKDDKDFASACMELGLTTEQAAQVFCIHWEQEQTELSAVLIGANPDAVARAHKSGALNDSDLASIGFSDDDMNLLHDAAPLWGGDRLKDASLALQRAQIRRHFAQVTHLKFSATATTETPPPSKERASGSEERKRGRSRAVAALRDALAKTQQ